MSLTSTPIKPSSPGRTSGEIRNHFAIAALRADGSVVTWGNSTMGGDSSAVVGELDGSNDVVEIFSTMSAFAALRADGSVVTWGVSANGGNSSAVASELDGSNDVVEIFSTGIAFAALRADGSVVTWGDSYYGGDSSAVASQLNGTIDVVEISSTGFAFAALRADGSVLTWGANNAGGDSSAVASQLNGTIDVVEIFSTSNAFAALRADGSVATWGDGNSGGDSSAVASQLNGTIDVIEIFSTNTAFAALRADGSVVTWWVGDVGGDSSAVASQLNGSNAVVEIFSTYLAFAALRADGSVVTWGESGWGGDSSAVASQLDGSNDVVEIFSTGNAFAALRADGSVVTWGVSANGGNSSAVASELDGSNDVVEIFSTGIAFAALRADGSVVTWGDSYYGGDSSAVASQLNGTIDVVEIFSTDTAFAALRADGSVVTWGNSGAGGDSSAVASQLDGTLDVVSMANPFSDDEYTSNADVVIAVDPRGTYLNAAPTDAVNAPTTVLLSDLGLQAGDMISLSRSGAYQAGISFSDTSTSMLAVFSDGSGFVAPDTYLGYTSLTQSIPPYLPTDVAQDFFVVGNGITTVKIPVGAVSIKFSPSDSYFEDNTDPNGDYAVRVSKVVGTTSYAGTDLIFGTAADDSLVGGVGNDTLYGGDGNDTLLGQQGSDSVYGGAGNDTLDGGAVLDRINYTDLNYTSYFYATDGVSIDLSGITGDGSVGSGTASGNASVGTDTISNVSFLQGSGYGDTITGSSALIFEQIEGGAGNDTLDGGAITDTLNGDNSNRVAYHNATGAGVTVDLIAGTAVGAVGSNIGSDTLLNFNQVRGTNFDDTILGSDRTDLTESYEGRGGDDLIDGRGGFDYVRYDSATAGVTGSLVNGIVTGAGIGTDTLVNMEGLFGSSFDDLLIGGGVANGVTVSDGKSEIFRGGAGNDTIDGGQGYDRADYTSSTAGVVVVLNDTLDGTASDGLGGTDVLRNIEGVRGSTFNDTLTGSDTAVFESFEGREGNDSIDGKGGIDRADYQNTKSGVTVDLTTGSASDGYGDTDTLLNIENVRGSRDFADFMTGSNVGNYLQGLGGNDTLDGGAGDDTLEGGLDNDVLDGEDGVDQLFGGDGNDSLAGGAGADNLYGGAGDDTLDGGADADRVYYYDAIGPITVNLALGTASGAGIGADALISVENVYGSQYADLLTGDANGNSLQGNDGNDSLDGGDGDDQLNGGKGNDSILGGAGHDNLYGDAGDDTLTGGADSDYFQVRESSSDTSVDTITDFTAGAGGDNLSITTWLFTNYAGSNPFATGHARLTQSGTDTLLELDMDGPAGAGVFQTAAVLKNVVKSTLVAANLGGFNPDVIGGTELGDSLTGTTGDDQISGGAGNDTLAGLAGNDTLEGGLDNDVLDGGDGVDQLFGGDGNDSILGGAGADNLVGGAGDDTLDGGADADTVQYHDATGPITVDLALGTASGAGIGADNLISIENVYGSQYADTLTGDANGNSLNGNDGNDSLTGGGGNDYLDGGKGDDNLNGGKGNDFLQGGKGSDVLNGGDGDDQLYGGDGNDGLAGGAGADNLVGGAGDDTLDGGADADTVQYYDATGPITVDLALGTASGAGIGADNLISIENVYGSQYADALTGDTNSNYLYGNGGNDTLVGGAGNDTLDGGNGLDRAVFTGNKADYSVVYDASTSQFTVTDSVGGRDGADTFRNVEMLQFADGTTLFDVVIAVDPRGTYLNAAPTDAVNAPTTVLLSDLGLQAGDMISLSRSGAYQAGISFSDTSTSMLAVFSDGSGFVAPDTYLGYTSLTQSIPPYLPTDVAQDFFVVGNGITTVKIPVGAVSIKFSPSDSYFEDNTDPNGDYAVRVSKVVGTTSYAGTDLIFGTAADDSLVGGVGNDTLYGGDGNDTLLGQQGSDSVYGGAGNDTLDGGAVLDRINYTDLNYTSYFYATDGVSIDLSGITGDGSVGSGTASGNASVGTDTISNVSFLQGSGYGDTITGSSALIFEQIEGGAGNDTLDGGVITDTLNQNNGNRVAYHNTTGAGVTVDFLAGTAVGAVGSNIGSDTLVNFNEARGSSFDDTLLGSNRTDVTELYEGRGGNDSIDGRGGFDIVKYGTATAGITADLVAGNASVRALAPIR
jgi:Ca2+-binding RTX toxin-like protein